MFNFSKWRWWHWLLATLLLLALCDSDSDNDDDDEFCYMFGEKRICFVEPLPEDKYCYLMNNDKVQCFDEPRNLK
jgi:hypothetical protein